MQMNKEHTIVNGASRLDTCAEHVKKVMGDQGYRASVIKIAGGSVTQVHVAKTGMSDKIVAFATLNLWSAGDDLKFTVENNVAVSNPADGIASPLTILLGVPVKFLLDMSKQIKLEEQLYLAASMFLTAS